MVNNLSVEVLDEPKSIEKLRCATARDPVLCKVLEYNRSGWPSVKRLVEPQVAEYYSMRFELKEHNGCLYKGTRVIVPQECRQEYLKQLHVGHPGVNRCKALAR